MNTFLVRIDDGDMEILDKRRGKLGRGQYLIELMRRYDLGVIERVDGVEKGVKKEVKKEVKAEAKGVLSRDWCRVHMSMEDFEDGECIKCKKRRGL